MLPQPLSRLHHQSGIALGPILFIIAILAILGASIAAGFSMFNGNTNADSAKVLASATIERAENYKSGAQLLLAHECDLSQLFLGGNGLYGWNATNGGSYANANAPADHHCDLFSPLGANALSANVTDLWGQYNVTGFHPNSMFLCGGAVPHVGTSLPELMYVVQDLSQAVCTEINARLGISTIPSSTQLNYYFNGTCNDGSPFNMSNVTGVRTVCYRYNATERFVFMSVLVER